MQAFSDPAVGPLHMSSVWHDPSKSPVHAPSHIRPHLGEASSHIPSLNGSKHKPELGKQSFRAPETPDYERRGDSAYKHSMQSASSDAVKLGVSSPPENPLSMSNTHDQRSPVSRTSTPSPDSDSVDGTCIKKRTASGTVKISDGSTLGHANQSVARRNPSSHSRNTSTNSVASSVGDLSLQLKTRLNYAMSKVQQGQHSPSVVSPIPFSSLEMHPTASLSDVSHRRSQSLRPTGDVVTSPNWRPQDIGQAMEQSPISNSLASEQPTLSALEFRAGGLEDNTVRQGNRTLAPAPEIVSTQNRRTNGIHKKPSLLNASRVSVTPVSNTNSQGPTSPATPTPQEQDAVDTLLFMSGSPASSSNFPRRANAIPSTQISPRKPRFGVSSNHDAIRSSTKQLVSAPQLFSPISNSSNSDAETMAPNTQREVKRRSTGLMLATEQDVDRLLDQIAANRSGDEEDQATLNSRPNGTGARTNESSINAQS